MNSIKRYHLVFCLFIGIIITIYCHHSRTRNDKINIICYGDSIVEGAFFNNWPKLLQKKLNAWRPGQYKVINKGINGATSSTALSFFEGNVSPYLPGHVLIAFGINDANYRFDQQKPRVEEHEFRQNIRQLYEWIAFQKGNSILIINHPLSSSERYRQGNNKSYNENLNPYNLVLAELSKELFLPAIDMYSLFEEKQSQTGNLLKEDGVHLTPRGAEVYAEGVFQTLRSILESN